MRVLFVDDETFLVDLGRRMLDRLGHQVTACQSGVEALEAFRASPQDFDLVITDQSMPVLTGSGLAEEIKRIRPEIPIILCTGLGEQDTRAQVNLAGISALVTKPFSKQKIADTIGSVSEPS